MKDLDIGEVAEKSGLPPATLRFYEQKGLIAPSGRNGLRRLYDPRVLQALALIMLGQKAGFSLDEIREFASPNGETRVSASRLRQQADQIDQRIRELTVLRDGLYHVAQCSAPSHSQCPRFKRLMKVGLARLGDAAKRPKPKKARP